MEVGPADAGRGHADEHVAGAGLLDVDSRTSSGTPGPWNSAARVFIGQRM
jgi:hypothetical protein